MTRAQPAGALERVAETVLPTRWGTFRTLGFERQTETAIVLMLGDPARGTPLVRIHSQCFTGDVFHSLRCDCGEQLDLAMRAIAEEGCGILIYEQQEGRGIGLMAKLRAYALQDDGLDTIAANHALGFAADCRDFRLPAAILKDLGIRRVRLLSNNPEKARALTTAGILVVEQLPCEASPNPHARRYLQVKKERMGHTLRLV
ncbi:MAG TPA: GTP cyclohydrolase II [Bryobacteraceae bacterium]|nr:GTP cyclohydrolase II [Bryobacteraceae bacterium]